MKPLADERQGWVRLPFDWRRAVAAVGVALGLLLPAGCGSASGSGSNTLGAQVLQNPSSFEMRVLKDKHVTQAELDESKQIYVECLKSAGLTVVEYPGPNGDSSPWVVHTGAPDPDDDIAKDRCDHLVNAVQAVWILQNHVSASDLDRMEAQFVACVRDAGLPIKGGTTFTGAQRALTDFMESLGHYDNSSPEGVIASKSESCRQDFQNVSGAQPHPGLQEALNQLDTSGW